MYIHIHKKNSDLILQDLAVTTIYKCIIFTDDNVNEGLSIIIYCTVHTTVAISETMNLGTVCYVYNHSDFIVCTVCGVT